MTLDDAALQAREVLAGGDEVHSAALQRAVADVATLERGLIAALILLIVGIALGVVAVGNWGALGYGVLPPTSTMRLVIPSATAILIAFQTAYGAFFVSVLEIRSTRSRMAEPG